MKQFFYKFFLLLSAFLVLTSSISFCQNLTGIWRGYFFSSGSDQYKFELQVSHKGGTLYGVSYSYLSTVFYGKATLAGKYNRISKNIIIQEIKTTELKMSSGSSACIMKCDFQYVRSGKEEFLEGTFTSKFENNTYGAKKGENCGGGKVFLRKVQSSDFYSEPFLRKKDPLTQPVSKPKVNSRPVVKKENNRVAINKIETKRNIPIKNPSVTKSNPSKNTDGTPVKTSNDSLTRVKQENTPVLTTPALPSLAAIRNRENNIVKTLTVNTENIIIKLFDNGEIDDDTISVFLDQKLILSKKRLTAVALIISLKMNEDTKVHELTMVADNLGRIPPNTSIMVVSAGDKTYDVRITSTEQKNAVVRFIYQKPN